jgi:hypothetical protein
MSYKSTSNNKQGERTRSWIFEALKCSNMPNIVVRINEYEQAALF